MNSRVTKMDLERATDDLKNRTLARLAGGEIARLVFLASTRNYNTGRYYHDGLAFRFDEKVVSAALSACHQEIFEYVAFGPIENLIQELDLYISSTHEKPADVLEAWQKLESYRVTIPMGCNPYTVDLFFSNVRVALEALMWRQQEKPAGRRCASPLRSLAQ